MVTSRPWKPFTGCLQPLSRKGSSYLGIDDRWTRARGSPLRETVSVEQGCTASGPHDLEENLRAPPRPSQAHLAREDDFGNTQVVRYTLEVPRMVTES